MLTQDEKKFLQSILKDRKVKIIPFSQKAEKIAQAMIAKVKQALPELDVRHMGASDLGISGQPDLDIYALADPKDFDKYLPSLKKIFGKLKSSRPDSIAWEFEKEGYQVEFYLTDPNSPSMKKQIAVFEILKNDKRLLEEYEQLKAQMNGRSYREYQRKKYEFYHRILGSDCNIR